MTGRLDGHEEGSRQVHNEPSSLLKLAKLTEVATPLPALPSPDNRLRLRRAAGLSRAGAAVVVGVSEKSITRWEQGKNAPGDGDVRYRQFLAVCGATAERPAV
jgi:DNA-binding transcriptional regulator YiaG